MKLKIYMIILEEAELEQILKIKLLKQYYIVTIIYFDKINIIKGYFL